MKKICESYSGKQVVMCFEDKNGKTRPKIISTPKRMLRQCTTHWSVDQTTGDPWSLQLEGWLSSLTPSSSSQWWFISVWRWPSSSQRHRSSQYQGQMMTIWSMEAAGMSVIVNGHNLQIIYDDNTYVGDNNNSRLVFADDDFYWRYMEPSAGRSWWSTFRKLSRINFSDFPTACRPKSTAVSKVPDPEFPSF